MMKRPIFSLIAIVALTNNIYAQQWGGSSNTSNDIFRPGRIRIGTNTAANGLLVTHNQVCVESNSDDLYLNNGANSTGRVWLGKPGGTGTTTITALNDFYAAGGIFSGGYLKVGSDLKITYNQICVENTVPGVSNDLYVNNAYSGSGNVIMGKSGAGMVTIKNDFAINGSVISPMLVDNTLKLTNNQICVENGGGDLFVNNTTNGNGNVIIGKAGVGTVTAKNKLVVGGELASWSPHNSSAIFMVKGKGVLQEVVVTQQNWADFVFDKNYKLTPLSEVESYYKENHHLPEVPTTKEIQENGNDLGKTDAILLQKIEELTLYVVELQKQIDSLRKSNDSSK